MFAVPGSMDSFAREFVLMSPQPADARHIPEPALTCPRCELGALPPPPSPWRHRRRLTLPLIVAAMIGGQLKRAVVTCARLARAQNRSHTMDLLFAYFAASLMWIHAFQIGTYADDITCIVSATTHDTGRGYSLMNYPDAAVSTS
jgi:hypothetical protein